MKNADNIKYLLRSADHSGSATVPYQQVVVCQIVFIIVRIHKSIYILSCVRIYLKTF